MMNALRRTSVLLIIPLLAAACDDDDPSSPSGSVIALSPSTVVFETSAGRDPQPATVDISSTAGNVGNLQASTTFISGGGGWLTVNLSSTSAPATLTLTPAVGELAPGAYNAVVILTGEGAQNSPKGLAVVLRVLGGPHVFRYTPPAGAAEVTSVSVRGEMNGWGETPMTFANGEWSVTMPLDTGTYHYKYFINGSWPGNMCNDESWGHPDENFWIDVKADGCRDGGDARIHIGVPPGAIFEYIPPAGAPAVNSVSLRGEMNGWGETPMLFLRKPPTFATGSWRVTATNLDPGTYHYKFFINDTWPGNMCHDETWGHPDKNFYIDREAEGCRGDSDAHRTF